MLERKGGEAGPVPRDKNRSRLHERHSLTHQFMHTYMYTYLTIQHKEILTALTTNANTSFKQIREIFTLLPHHPLLLIGYFIINLDLARKTMQQKNFRDLFTMNCK